MKPIKLTMEGFGPYLNKTEIDFNELGDGLTLITGNTGAGKTTIFDAICCALYGETSGGARSFSQMRTEGAPAKCETKVTFEFELKGKRYLVERSPSYERKKQKGEGMTSVGPKAVMTYPDGNVTTKSNAVTGEIKELLGIGKDEFKQIVMIAQNDFMAMLTESGTNQDKIFNKIFDTSLYQKFTDRVKAEYDQVKNKIGNNEERVKEALSQIDFPAKSEAVEPEKIIEEVKVYITDLEKDLPEKKQKVSESEKAFKKLQQEELMAQELGKKFKQLKEKAEERDQLLKEKTEIEQEKEKLLRAEIARDQVEPVYRSYKQVKDSLTEIEANRKETAKQESQAQVNEEHARKALEAYPDETYIKLSQTFEKLKENLPEYEALSTLQGDCQELEKKEKQFQDKIKDCETKIETDQKTVGQLEIKEPGYFIAEQIKRETEKKELDELDSVFEKTRGTIVQIRKDIDQYVEGASEFQQALKDYEEAERRSVEAFRSYMEDQAYFIAQEELKPNEPCPVCGSLDHPHPARKKSQTSISKSEVDQLETEARDLKAETERITGKQTKRLEAVREGYKVLNFYDQKLSAADKVLCLEEKLDVTSYLKVLADLMKAVEEPKKIVQERKALNTLYKDLQLFIKQLGNRTKTVTDELSRLEKEEKQNNHNQQQKDILEKRIEEWNNQLTVLKEDRHLLDLEIGQKKAQLEEKQKRLSYHSLEEAKTALKKRENELSTFVTEKQKLIQKQTQWSEKLNQLRGTGESLKRLYEENKEHYQKLKESFERHLIKAQFESEEAFLSSLLKPEQIEAVKQTIREYENKLLVLNKECSDLEVELKGKAEPDLDFYEEQVRSAQDQMKTAQDDLFQQKSKIQSADDVLKRIKNLSKRLGEDMKRAGVLKALYDTIHQRGNSFSQYVLSIYFKKVLAKANMKLAEMTNGVYQLQQDSDHVLDIKVYDAISGESRSVKTLSGGETFMASLSLALGLSEVVEEQNGGIRLDTIFIDEGFGSLDPDNLERAIDVLSKLSQERRVAIISHVEQLKERVPQQILIHKNQDTSTIKIKTI